MPEPKRSIVSNTISASSTTFDTFGGTAVLDKETGLVWEQAPTILESNWRQALGACFGRVRGGRSGWRLPTMPELMSLTDATQTNPALPLGYPFSNVQSSDSWSATTYVDDSTVAWNVHFDIGALDINGKLDQNFVWCVRSGYGGPDAQ